MVIARSDSAVVVLPEPDDFGVTLRDGDLLAAVLPSTACVCSRARVEPCAASPVLTGNEAVVYRERIRSAALALGREHFEPLMTIAITPKTTPETVRIAHAYGVVAGALYPAPQNPVLRANVRSGELVEVLSAMQDVGMVLSLHAGDPAAPLFQREQAYLPTVEWILERWPKLKVVLETISTEAAVKAVLAWRDAGRKVAATVGVAHLYLTVDDLLGSGMKPFHYLTPLPKHGQDRQALRWAVTRFPETFFFASGSDPVLTELKLSPNAPPGCFTAPFALGYVIQLFEQLGAMGPPLLAYVATGGADFYGLPRATTTTVFEKREPPLPTVPGFAPWLNGWVPSWRRRQEGTS